MKWMYGVLLALCCMLLCACSVAPVRIEVLDIETAETAEAGHGTPAPTLLMNSGGVKPAAAVSEPAASPVAIQTKQPEKSAKTSTPVATPSPTPSTALRTPEPTVEATPEPAPAQDAPMRVKQFFSESMAVADMPAMLDATAMEYVFQALARAGINAETENLHVQVTCNTSLLFSCIAEVEKQSGKNGSSLYPVTVDMHNGKVLSLSDFFSSADREWRSVLPDIVTEIADEKGMTLLCEVPPVSDDQPFYINQGDIVLVYRPYEITTYDSGEPCFELPMREIAPYTTGAYGIGG